MTNTGDALTARQSLEALAVVLEDLSVALASGRDDAVLQVEARVAAAIDAARRTAAARITQTESLNDVAARVRDHVGRCRRLGGTVPALLSVMFPGRSMYGRDGLRRDTSPSARPAIAQVI